MLITTFSSIRLKIELDKVPLWRGDHFAVRQLAEDFARYLYLPRLATSITLVRAIQDGVSLLTWERDSLAWADEYDAEASRYRGLRCGQSMGAVDPDGSGLLVKADVALKQLERESRPVRLAVSPERIELARNATCRFMAKAFDADGRGLQVSRPRWSATGGTIDQTGQFVTHAEPGQFTLEVSYQGLHAQSTVVVMQAPAAPRHLLCRRGSCRSGSTARWRWTAKGSDWTRVGLQRKSSHTSRSRPVPR